MTSIEVIRNIAGLGAWYVRYHIDSYIRSLEDNHTCYNERKGFSE